MLATTDGLPTPEWWLDTLVNDLLKRQDEFKLRGRYVEGNHDLPQGDVHYMRALSQLRRLAPTNYIGLVTQAPVQRMNVRGFRFGEQSKGPAGSQGPQAPGAKPPTKPKPQKKPGAKPETATADDPSTVPITSTFDDDARKIWVANDMDLQSASLHNLAAKYGLAYTLVSPVPDDEDFPIITAEDPRTCIIYRDPVRPTKALAGLRMWTDDILGRVVAVLYLPEAIYTYYGPEAALIQNLTLQNLRNTLMGLSAGGRGFELVEVQTNEIEQVPIVEYVWRPNSANFPEGEAGRDVCVIQDRINATILDRISISRSQAYKQRWATGVEAPKKDGSDTEWDPGADIIWATKNKDAQFGEFQATDIRMILEAIRDDVSDIAAITQTPAHYLMGKIANISGETLSQAETGLVKKTKLRMKSMGWSHERTMKLAFAYMKDSRADEVDAEVVWEDPEQNALVDQASAASQMAAAGIPLQLILERLNFSEEQIQFAVQEAERQSQMQMDQQMEMAKQQAALAPAGQPGKPGTGNKPAAKKPSPNSTKKKP